MFCIKCGNELKDNDLFCCKCGTQVEHNINFDTTQNVETIQPTSNMNKKIFLGIIYVVIMFLIFGWAFGLFKSNPYIGTWESRDDYTIVINKDGTGIMSDGIIDVKFRHEYRPQSLGQLAIYISGKADTYCYMNSSKDMFSYEGINFYKK